MSAVTKVRGSDVKEDKSNASTSRIKLDGSVRIVGNYLVRDKRRVDKSSKKGSVIHE